MNVETVAGGEPIWAVRLGRGLRVGLGAQHVAAPEGEQRARMQRGGRADRGAAGLGLGERLRREALAQVEVVAGRDAEQQADEHQRDVAQLGDEPARRRRRGDGARARRRPAEPLSPPNQARAPSRRRSAWPPDGTGRSSRSSAASASAGSVWASMRRCSSRPTIVSPSRAAAAASRAWSMIASASRLRSAEPQAQRERERGVQQRLRRGDQLAGGIGDEVEAREGVTRGGRSLHERGDQRHPLRPLGRLGERALQAGHRRARIGAGHRVRGRLAQPRDHPRVAARRGTAQLGGDLLDGGAGGVDDPGRPAVIDRRRAAGDAVVDGRAHERMGEAQRQPRSEDGVVRQLVGGRGGRPVLEARQRGRTVQVGARAEHGDRARERRGVAGQRGQARGQGARDRVGHEGRHRAGRAGVGHDAVAGQRARELAQQKRVAGARLVARGAEALVGAGAEDAAHDLGRAGCGERRQGDDGRPGLGAEQGVAVGVGRPARHEQGHGQALEPAGEVAQPVRRGLASAQWASSTTSTSGLRSAALATSQ